MSEKEHYKLNIEPITCVHIGTGETLTPLDYKIHTLKSGKNVYLAYSTDSILQHIAKDEAKLKQFDELTKSNDMAALAKFFSENVTSDDRTAICDVTNEFFENFKKNAKKDPLENAREVLQMYRNGLNPVISGSSLKGSIRTAVLNARMRNGNDYNTFPQKASEIQKKLLNYTNAKDDPFRAIEIGDCKFDGNGIEVVGILKNIKTRADEVEAHNDSQIQAEVLKGSLMKAKTIGNGKICINGDLCCPKGVSKLISMNEIIDSCNYFFWREFKKEYDKFYSQAVDGVDLIGNLKDELEAVKNSKNQFIVRVGSWSQVEFVTFEENFRNPKTPKIKGKQLPYGTTRTVFDYDGQYLPLGWCKCSVEKQ